MLGRFEQCTRCSKKDSEKLESYLSIPRPVICVRWRFSVGRSSCCDVQRKLWQTGRYTIWKRHGFRRVKG
ncbi:hypothetical protein HBI79_014750 [Parastagonospora nodorum]|nr:hypothetical protein HBI79_014750 [Parastagonospora nodorum]